MQDVIATPAAPADPADRVGVQNIKHRVEVVVVQRMKKTAWIVGLMAFTVSAFANPGVTTLRGGYLRMQRAPGSGEIVCETWALLTRTNSFKWELVHGTNCSMKLRGSSNEREKEAPTPNAFIPLSVTSLVWSSN